jgi:hypothetical protein
LFSNFAGELEKARGYLGSTPQIMTRVSETFADLGDNFAAIGDKGKEFMVGLLERLAPGLADLTDRLANIDAAGFGAKLSEYAEKTVAWITETFKLNEALNGLEVAVKGITSGNFADGLSLMFLTARDTALNAINNIVAAAGAALQTIGGALQKLFAPGSTTMAFIEGSFQMLGAKIAAGVFDSLAGVLEKLPFMDAAAAAVREAQKEAEQAVKDISNIMYYEADNLKSEWGGIMAEMPKEFARSYAANMEKPLFEMKDRAAETADQMERVAAATRAAAFDAEAFGQALRDAQVDRLAGMGGFNPLGGPAETGEGMGQNAGDRKFPWQGARPSGPQIIDKTGTAGAAGGTNAGQFSTRMSSPAPTPLTQDQTVAQMRADAARNRRMGRFNEFMDAGMFRTAARTQEAADRAGQRILNNQAARDFGKEMFGSANMGEAFKNWRDEMKERGGLESVFGVSQKDFENWVKEQSRSTEERQKEIIDRRSDQTKSEDRAASAKDPMSAILEHVASIDEKLPLNALGGGE